MSTHPLAHATDLARQHPLLSTLGARDFERLLQGSRLLQLRPKRTLLREGEPAEKIFFLSRGAVRVFHRHQRHEVLLKLFRAPALFGEMEAMTGRSYIEYVMTLEETELLVIPRALFLDLLHGSPAFSAALAVDLAARLCVAAHNIRAVAFGDLQARIAHLLLDYAQFFGVREGERIRLTLALSQAMMAKDLAVSRNAVNDALTQLKRAGLIDKQKARYVLLKPDELLAVSTGTISLSYSSDWTTRSYG